MMISAERNERELLWSAKARRQGLRAFSDVAPFNALLHSSSII